MRVLISLCLVPVVLLFGGCWNSNPAGSDDTTPWPRGMKLIKGGTFQISGVLYNTQPVHRVTVSSFYMDLTEVTQEDYQRLMGRNPSNSTGDPRRPVEQVSWYEAVLYCNARSKRDHLDTVYYYTGYSTNESGFYTVLSGLVVNYAKNGYRLPTDAEWEYACRAGTTTDYYWGNSIDGRYCWYGANSGIIAQPVGTKLPNAWGLYDMSGNVWEWCNDWYADCSFSSSSSNNLAWPVRPFGTERVLRGGSCYTYDLPRSADRTGLEPFVDWFDVGFRCVRSGCGDSGH